MNDLGKIGFDIIKISGFTQEDRFEEPVLYHLCLDEHSIDKLLHSSFVTVNKSHVSITGYGYEFRWGNSPRGAAYCNLTLHADPDGYNLCNMSVTDVRQKIEETIRDLYDRYRITFPNLNPGKLTITYAEINRTVETDRPFHEYADFLDLLRFAYSGDDGKFMLYKMGNRIQSEYIAKASTYEIKAYDKKAELSSKLPLRCSELEKYTGLFRLEITVKKEIEIKTSGNCAYLDDLTDDFLENYFKSKLKKKLNKAIKIWKSMGLSSYTIKRKGQDDDTVPSLVGLFLECTYPKGLNNSSGYEEFLSKVYYIETAKLGRPFFPGLSQFEIDLRHYLNLNGDCVTTAISLLNDICNKETRFHRFINRDSVINHMIQLLLK